MVGHEIGHVLGFRHEQTRPEAGVYFEDNEWRPLTESDSASIMHYPECNTTSNDLSFTRLDGMGAAALYGEPNRESPPPEPLNTDRKTGEIARDQWLDLASYDVKPGSRSSCQWWAP